VLYAHNQAGVHGLQASFKQKLLEEGIAHLDSGPLFLRAFVEFLAGHRGAVYTVPARPGSHVNHRIDDSRGPAVKNLVAPRYSQAINVDHRVIGIMSSKDRLPAHRGNTYPV